MPTTSRALIDRFLATRRLAFIGVSRNHNDFSRSLFREFLHRGYEVIPVSPALTEAEGRPGYANVRDIRPPVEAALIMTSSAVSEEVVRECAGAGVKQIWLYRAGGEGAVSEGALRACEESGIDVVAGECPYMFWPANFPHNIHGWIRKLTHSYPRP
jgi:predicted CoA-binding protein